MATETHVRWNGQSFFRSICQNSRHNYFVLDLAALSLTTGRNVESMKPARFDGQYQVDPPSALLFPEQVNTGNYRKAVELFRGLLSLRPGLVGAHLGLGSALALLGGMENAVASFSAAIEVTRVFRQ